MGEACSHLSEEERRVIQIEIGNGTIICGIVLMLGRNASTVGREIKRDTWFPSNENESYRPYRPKSIVQNRIPYEYSIHPSECNVSSPHQLMSC
ncbi:helix-turn-helix domain-containing protein [Bifidobacterium longum]|uniref:helix-turn-helix domain-containing protein n=1 Tax=Bifidobacterium longum TaxID=216816 RepID=UPI0039170987